MVNQHPEQDEEPGTSWEELDEIIPKEWGVGSGSKLRACLSCSLVKTVNQFLKWGCENCQFLNMSGDKVQVSECTSSAIIGIYTLIAPKSSWVAKWQRTMKFQPGCYAIAVDAILPEAIEEQILAQGLRPGRTKATSLAMQRQ